MPPTTAEVSTENGKLEDSQILLNSLKYCLRKVTSSSLNVHKEIFAENLPKCLENPAFQDAHLKGFAKILANVVPRYSYKKSKLVVEKFISKVLKKHGLTFAKVLISEIHPIAVLLAKLNPCISNSSQACMLLRWCNLIYALVSDLPDQVACMLASSEMLAYNAVCAEGSSWYGYRLLAYAEKTLTENKSPAVFIKYLDVMLKNPQVEWLSGVGFIYQYLTNKKSVHLVKPETRKSLLEMFINTSIQTKLSAPIHSLKFIKPMLKYLSHDDFKEVFPLIKKGLLRNPETIMLGAGYFFSGLSIDLSQHIDELLDSIPAHLASKNEAISEPATFTVQQIALQCSQCSAVQKLIEKLIKILAGSEGKLAQPEHRALVLKSLRDASETPGNSSDRETLAGVVFDKLTPLVTVEAHEWTQIEGVNALKSWSKYFVNSLPKNFFEVFKKIMTAKTQSPVTRPYYIQMATEALKGNLLIEEVMQIIEVLTQTVEKSIGHQVNTVYEALVAATLLSRIATLDHLPEGKLDSFWNFALNPTKRPLLSEKFLSSATPEQLEQLEKFTSSLFTNHSERVTFDKIKPWYSAFVTLITGGGWKTVKQTKLLIKNVGMQIEGFYEALADEAHNVLLQGGENMEVVAGKLANFYHYLVCVQPAALEKSEFLMKHCFLPIHHPLIEATPGNMFGKVFNSIKVPLKDLAKHAQQILNTVFQRNELNESDVNTLRALIKLFPESLLALSMQKIDACTDDPALLQVTEYEIGVLATPAGEVYDQSIYESAKKINTKHTNVKRENKAYSYKEEKADQELKEEMRRKNGEHKKIELSKKQQEQLEAIKVQENEIRQRLGDLKREFSKHITLLQLWIESRSALLKPHFGTLINTCIALLRSGFSAPHILPCFLQLSQVIYDGELHHLGEFIGNTVVRHLQPPCELPLAWQHEQLDAMTRRALNTIHAFTHERNSYLMMAYTWKKPFTAPAFAYMLPLLKVVLKNRGAVMKHDEGLRMKALQIIMAHCNLRSADPTDMMDEHGPQLLPRADTLRVLSEVIMACDGHTKDAKIQLYANTVFDELCKASSSKDGAATASIAEVELLLGNVLSQCTLLRNASLKGLLEIVDALVGYYDQIEDTLARRTLIVRFDVDDVNAQLAQKLWEEADLNITGGVTCDLVDDVTHALSDVRQAACEAVKTAVAEQPTLSAVVLQTLLETYKERNKIPPPVIDNLGRVVSAPFVDPWEARHGVGLAIGKIYEHVPEDQLETLFHFFIPMAFGDRNENVRKQMLDSALLYVNHFGQNNINMLLSMFETFLDSAPDSSAHDVIRQSVVILTGSLAKNFQKTDPKIKPIFSKLMTGLATPSQQVQKAVADCLPPLCAAIKEEAPELIKGLLNQLFESESYGERRGAAFGLAGIIKGLGILSLKQHNIISTLNDAIQDKKAWKHREGALFAFETLCTMLGRLFEPYVVHLLPHLLLCFGDGNQYVREAADETAKAVMRNLSNHGVKLVLPSLLKALEEDSWRTKTGSAELLGAMSFCAPKQLSSCLPSIVPRLTEILADSHLKVQKAGQQALRQIGGVIRNPEILEISEIILDALSDPNRHTVGCLQALLNTSFVHFIDAPSLALIMPTLERALEQRPTETKKMAAQILGNMYALTDPKDLSPYLPAVVPGLKKSLLDPSPEVRGVSARALGAIVKGMGEECFNDLMPWLLETLTSDISSVDRSGAAQGLSEVLHALGQERLDKLMPDVIDTTMKVELPPNIREGYLMLYIYLPTTFGDDFIVYISSIIPAILKGLADESEYVRETSLKAGQRIISMYSDSAIQLLLPQLEAGLFDEHWRIRYSSVQLLGDLLFKLSGVTGKQSTVGDEDDNFGTAHSAQVILETLGEERRNHVFAGLYMGRSDVALQVRQSSLHVWKVIVQNTAKTLREILPTLFELLLGCLASDCYDKRQVAARTLGDLVRKLGERILPEIIPILEDGLNNEEGSKRQGVCIGLSEIMDSCSREMMSTFEDSLVNTVRAALLDPLPEVRYAASLTFENLHNTIGHKALDGVLPHVFEKLEDESLSEFALDGLKQVMAVKSKSVLPFLVPRLTEPPVNTKALSILASVAGEALVKHLDRILPAMIEAIHATNNENNEFEGTQSLLMSVEDETGVRIIIDELTAATKNQKPGLRKVGADLLCVFCKETQADYTVYVQSMFIVALQLMNDVDALVAEAGWLLLDSLVKRLDPSEQLMHLSSLKQAIRFVKPDIRNNQLPGFCILKKGVTPVIPMFREGVLNGPQDVKEQASLILGDVIRLTSPAALRPSVVHITGPLIRILGDRFAFSVKVAILDTLGLLLEKVGVMLKPFFAQLQTTFIKALNDANRNVRKKSAWALGLLSLLHSRLDSLFTELKNGVKNNEDPAIRETTLLALRTIILNGGAKMGDAVKSAMFETLVEFVDASEDSVRVASGAALGALCQVLSNDDLEKLTSSLLDVNPTLDWIVCHGRAVALSYALYHSPSQVLQVCSEHEIVHVAVQHTNNDRVPICISGVHSLGHLLLFSNKQTQSVSPQVVESFRKTLKHSSNDVRNAALSSLKYACRNSETAPYDLARYFVPDFPALFKDRNSAVRASAELTLAYVLQLHKNDLVFDQCVADLPDSGKFLTDYKETVFEKIGDTLATDVDDYVFVT